MTTPDRSTWRELVAAAAEFAQKALDDEAEIIRLHQVIEDIQAKQLAARERKEANRLQQLRNEQAAQKARFKEEQSERQTVFSQELTQKVTDHVIKGLANRIAASADLMKLLGRSECSELTEDHIFNITLLQELCGDTTPILKSFIERVRASSYLNATTSDADNLTPNNLIDTNTQIHLRTVTDISSCTAPTNVMTNTAIAATTDASNQVPTINAAASRVTGNTTNHYWKMPQTHAEAGQDNSSARHVASVDIPHPSCDGLEGKHVAPDHEPLEVKPESQEQDNPICRKNMVQQKGGMPAIPNPRKRHSDTISSTSTGTNVSSVLSGATKRVRRSKESDALSGPVEVLYKQLKVMADNGYEIAGRLTCCACNEPPVDTRMTNKCKHFYCKGCLSGMREALGIITEKEGRNVVPCKGPGCNNHLGSLSRITDPMFARFEELAVHVAQAAPDKEEEDEADDEDADDGDDDREDFGMEEA